MLLYKILFAQHVLGHIASIVYMFYDGLDVSNLCSILRQVI